MKPASIVFLIVAVIFIIVGTVMCISAVNMAKEKGIQLYSSIGDIEGNTKETFELSSESISGITISLSDADVNIIGGSESNRIEFVNYPKGTCEFTVNNKILTVNSKLNLLSFFKISETGVGFDGFRHYLALLGNGGRERAVNAYLTSEDFIKVFTLSVEAGDLCVSGLSSLSDYNITCNGGSVALENLSTQSNVRVSAVSGELVITSPDIKNCIVEGKNVDVMLNGIPLQSLYLKTENGDITVDGVSKGNMFIAESAETPRYLSVICTGGNIGLKFENNNTVLE